MTTTPRADHAVVPVEQADRDLGRQIADRVKSLLAAGGVKANVTLPDDDANGIMQMIARHRLAATPKPAMTEAKEVREAYSPVDDAQTKAFIDGWNARLDHPDFEMARHHWDLSCVDRTAQYSATSHRLAIAMVIDPDAHHSLESAQNYDPFTDMRWDDALKKADAILALIGTAEGRAVSECAREAAQALWDDGHDAIGGEAADASLFAEQRHVAVMTSYIERTRRQDDVLRKAAQALLAQFDKYRESDLNHECAHRYLANDWRRWDDLRAALSTPEEQER